MVSTALCILALLPGACSQSQFVAMNNTMLANAVEDWAADFAVAAAPYGEINEWDTYIVTSMEGIFSRAATFNQDAGGWDTSKVASMEGTFYATDALTSL